MQGYGPGPTEQGLGDIFYNKNDPANKKKPDKPEEPKGCLLGSKS